MSNTSAVSVLAAFLAAGWTVAIAAEKPINSVTFACADARTIGADFFPEKVDLKLSDGRSLSLPQAMSGSGARYADKDEKVVFWNKGDGAFITEGGPNGAETFSNCTVKPKS